MKRIIIAISILTLTALIGCKKEEYFELEMAQEVTEAEEVIETAENQMDSRPFVVYVCGEVVNPGVYELFEGARFMDAIEAAGGYTSAASESYINLAELISDGQKIYVPSNEEIETEDIKYDSATFGAGEKVKVDINHATKDELMTLQGIGEAKANKIIEYREANGSFKGIEDIMNITGIKEGMFNKIKDDICVK